MHLPIIEFFSKIFYKLKIKEKINLELISRPQISSVNVI